MNNLLIQPAQLTVKTVVPGPSDGHSAGGDPPSSVKNDRSFEKTLQKARRKQVPDEQEQTLASETLPGQSTYAQNTAQHNQAGSPSTEAAQAGSALSSAQRVSDASAAGTPVQGTALNANALADGSLLVSVVAAAGEAGEQQAVEIASPQAAELSALASAEMPQTATQVTGAVEEAAPAEIAPDFAALLKNAKDAAAPGETKADPEPSTEEDKPVKLQQPLAVESGKSETAAMTDLQSQPAAESVPANKTKVSAAKEGGVSVTVLNHTAAVNSSDSAAPVIEPARMAEARQAQIIRQVSAGVETLTRTGQNTLRLQLFPENMGKIDLRMTMSKDGMMVTLLADTPTTSAVLNQHLPELRVTLAEAGVNIAGLSVNSGNVGGQYNAQDQRQALYSQSQFGQPSAAADKTSDERQAVRLRDPETNVDYLV